jgi:hypothetical protein
MLEPGALRLCVHGVSTLITITIVLCADDVLCALCADDKARCTEFFYVMNTSTRNLICAPLVRYILFVACVI